MTDGFDDSAFGVPSTLSGSSGVANSFLFNAQLWDGRLSVFLPQMAGSELRFLRRLVGTFTGGNFNSSRRVTLP